MRYFVNFGQTSNPCYVELRAGQRSGSCTRFARQSVDPPWRAQENFQGQRIHPQQRPLDALKWHSVGPKNAARSGLAGENMAVSDLIR